MYKVTLPEATSTASSWINEQITHTRQKNNSISIKQIEKTQKRDLSMMTTFSIYA
jgi:hypothetical protein